MGARCRHYNALLYKNYLSWIRAPAGTICEILMPIVLMWIVLSLKSRSDVTVIDNYTLYSLRPPLYPIATRDKSTDEFTVDITD